MKDWRRKEKRKEGKEDRKGGKRWEEGKSLTLGESSFCTLD